jgi:hypothetical protein
MRQIGFDRLLCRFFMNHTEHNNIWFLKGGYSLELRFEESRATKDVDLVLYEESLKNIHLNEDDSALKETLQEICNKPINDFFEFNIVGKGDLLANAPYGGVRYVIESKINEKRFVNFHIDISVNDISRTPLFDYVQGENWLDFAGIPNMRYASIAVEEVFAEKLHAYTLPRQTVNSRDKDLFDMVMLIEKGNLDSAKLIACINNVFKRRSTHKLPVKLSSPPDSWERSFEKLTLETGRTLSVKEAFNILDAYFEGFILRNY